MADEADGGAWYAEGAVSLATLAPGSYVVRALVTWDGRIVGRASRSIILERAASQ